MRPFVLLLLATAAVFAPSAAARSSPLPATCSAPRFEASDFNPGGEADRGWPGGVSVADINGDGALDVFITGGYDYVDERHITRTHSMLYLNDGHGHFRRVEDSPISNDTGYPSGSTWADVDHDGALDAFVSTELGTLDVFYHNDGRGQMRRQDLGDATTTRGANYSASWADIDGDGDLDLVVDGPALEPPGKNLVYRNDNGHFVRVTGVAIENGMSNPSASEWADFDNDGRPDLFVANNSLWRIQNFPPGPGEFETPRLYVNRGNWTFERAANEAFDNGDYPGATAAIGDVDNDGDLDVFLGVYAYNSRKRDRLFLNDGHGQFSEATDFVVPEHDQPSSSAALADFNGDGNLDLIYAVWNGGITLMAGDGHGHFTPVNDPVLSGRVSTFSSLAVGDFDGDGLPDVIIGNWTDGHEGRYALMLHNVSERCGDWVDLDIRDQYGAPNPPGSRVTLVTRGTHGEERRQLREANTQSGFRSQSASFFLFGVPRGERIVRAEVRWPDGRTRTLRGLRSNRRTETRE
jgi:hypothetical protein